MEVEGETMEVTNQASRARAIELHRLNPHQICTDAGPWVKWAFVNGWGSVTTLKDYVRRYEMLYSLKHDIRTSPTQYKAWEFLLRVELMEEDTTVNRAQQSC